MLLAVFVSRSATFVTMFQAAAKTLSAASTTPVARGILSSIRHYCKRTPTKLRVSEAVSGTELGANVKVQVTLTPNFITWYCLLICANN